MVEAAAPAQAVPGRAVSALAGRVRARLRRGVVSLSRRRVGERDLIWILGSPRSGSTWLLNLLGQDKRVVKVDEPAIGAHLGLAVADMILAEPAGVEAADALVASFRAADDDYFFSSRYRRVWEPAVRDLIVSRIRAQVLDRAGERSIRRPVAVIKEPNGSLGAEMLMSACPRSRLLFLLRDGRDVVDSALDASRSGSWAMRSVPGYKPSDDERLESLSRRAERWVWRTEAVQRAFHAHAPELRMLVRYEDLRADTEGVLASIAEWMGLDDLPRRLAEVARKLSFDQIPAEKRGPGKFARAGRPGLWSENLSAEEQAVAERIMGPKLRELGYR